METNRAEISKNAILGGLLMFEEIFQQVGKFTDLIIAYGIKYWYVSVPLYLLVGLCLINKIWCMRE